MRIVAHGTDRCYIAPAWADGWRYDILTVASGGRHMRVEGAHSAIGELSVSVATYGGQCLLPARLGVRRRDSYYILKRAMDLALSLCGLVVLSPVFAVSAAAIKLDSRGDVFFRQTRVGARRRRHGRGQGVWELRPFQVLKFRSMVHDADPQAHISQVRLFTSRAVHPEAHASYKSESDPRITRVGRVLRRYSIDELPQLINVLRGDMSLVGPRPVPFYEVEGYDQESFFGRFRARPGITGLWQISGRATLSLDDMMALDLELVDRRSLRLEAEILLKTLPAVVRHIGAS